MSELANDLAVFEDFCSKQTKLPILIRAGAEYLVKWATEMSNDEFCSETNGEILGRGSSVAKASTFAKATADKSADKDLASS